MAKTLHASNSRSDTSPRTFPHARSRILVLLRFKLRSLQLSAKKPTHAPYSRLPPIVASTGGTIAVGVAIG